MKSLIEKISIMQAALDGKPIQFRERPRTNWQPATSLSTLTWDWYCNDYRVAPPTPQIIYVNEYNKDFWMVHSSQNDAIHQATLHSRQKALRIGVKYQEVIE